MTDIPKVKNKSSKKRVGRGYGSGKGGHTAGRGMKGQKSRSSLNILFEGIKVKKSLLRRLPVRRGKDKFKPQKSKPVIIDLSDLNSLRAGSIVDLKALIKSELVDAKQAKKNGVKVLANGKLEKKLTVKIPVSKSAAEKIKKAGGKTA